MPNTSVNRARLQEQTITDAVHKASNDGVIEMNVTRQSLTRLEQQVSLLLNRVAALMKYQEDISTRLSCLEQLVDSVDNSLRKSITSIKAGDPLVPTPKPHKISATDLHRIEIVHKKLGKGYVTPEMMMAVLGVSRKIVNNLLWHIDQAPDWVREQQELGGGKHMYKLHYKPNG